MFNRTGAFKSILYLFLLFFVLSSQNGFAANGITFTSHADIPNGGTRFDMTFDSLTNEALIYPTYVSVAYSNGEQFVFNEAGEKTVQTTCNASSCFFFVPGLRNAGTYNITLDVYSPNSYTLEDELVATESIASWWTDLQIISGSHDIFTGASSIKFRLKTVPSSISTLNMGIFTDIEYTGIFHGNGSQPCVNEGAGSFLCDFVNLPPLCEVSNGGGCDGNFVYYLGINFTMIVLGGIDAVHRPLTAYQEGNYFGNLNYNQGMNLHQRFDMDTFEFINPTLCFYESPEPYHCWNMAYYLRWTQRYLTDFETLLRTSGQFVVTKQGSDAVVSMSVPRLPVGARGYGVRLAYYPIGSSATATEVLMNCTVSTCAPVTLAGINPDLYQFELRLYNNHPLITYEDLGSGTEVSFGEELYKTIKYGAVVNRQIFYNRSSSTYFGDGSGNPINSIDSTKIAQLPGQSSYNGNYSNYIKGLNGLVVDLKGNVGNVTSSDFQFATWNGISSGGFLPFSAIATITKFALDNGNTRIKIEFSDNAIRNTWLRVTVLSNERTGLFKNDVFYFGHVACDMYIGHTGSPSNVSVNAVDTIAVRQHLQILPNSVSVVDRYDVNKDGRVNAIDIALVRQNQSSRVLRFFTSPVSLRIQ